MMMTIFLDAPAQTLNYMIAGFCVIFGFMGIYALSLGIRRRNLERYLELLSYHHEEDE